MDNLVIYLIGYLLSYCAGRYFLRKELDYLYSWEEVIYVAFISLFSFFGFFIFILFILGQSENHKYKKNSEPPKWL